MEKNSAALATAEQFILNQNREKLLNMHDDTPETMQENLTQVNKDVKEKKNIEYIQVNEDRFIEQDDIGPG